MQLSEFIQVVFYLSHNTDSKGRIWPIWAGIAGIWVGIGRNLGGHCTNSSGHCPPHPPTHPPTSRASLDEIAYFSYLASLHLYFCNTSQFSCMFNCLDRNQIKANFWPAFFFLDYKQGSGCSPVPFWSYSGHKFTKVVMLLAFLCL